MLARTFQVSSRGVRPGAHLCLQRSPSSSASSSRTLSAKRALTFRRLHAVGQYLLHLVTIRHSSPVAVSSQLEQGWKRRSTAGSVLVSLQVGECALGCAGECGMYRDSSTRFPLLTFVSVLQSRHQPSTVPFIFSRPQQCAPGLSSASSVPRSSVPRSASSRRRPELRGGTMTASAKAGNSEHQQRASKCEAGERQMAVRGRDGGDARDRQVRHRRPRLGLCAQLRAVALCLVSLLVHLHSSLGAAP